MIFTRGVGRFWLSLVVVVWPATASGQGAGPGTGSTVEITIPSKTYPGGRHAWVYTPAGYPESCRGACNFMLVFDGSMYLGAMPLPEILDSLTATKRISPTVAVLFDNGAPPGRLADLANSRRFADFVGEELVPWARERYRVSRAADHSIIAGSSAGGLAAAYIAQAYPALFGNVLSQSGAFWRGNEGSNIAPFEWVTNSYGGAPRTDVRLFLDVGSMETAGAMGGAAPSLLDANRRLRDVLQGKGYVVQYFEVPGGQHSPETWAKRLPVGIVALSR